ncbi:hypothetical protein FQP90_08165 [Paenarthrobacter nitroguajacolicus]|uniref:Uncharacterized protein n=1 Tax=Paenarthrobacter nitroguajacolicus TaxID=211146 RepID=A0A558H4B5_PAENT|nr:hypothetical protein [Paenarthrobacter nitroguajacolicus]TVU63958.1 hypothetical protein FQP90_08165 [Paenarthrobacter nitroguajacolicus]
MNLSDVRYPADTKQAVRNLLLQEARKEPKHVPWWRKPAALTFAGLALAGSTAAGVYVALAPVDDKREIRCYFRADLTTEHPIAGSPGDVWPPYMTTGIMQSGFDAKNNPAPEDPNAGMTQVTDPIASCAALWDTNAMNPDGITEDLIPKEFVRPIEVQAPQTWSGDLDAEGNPMIPSGTLVTSGHYVPELTECVVENSVAVIPGPAEVCAKLGIPALEK